MNRTITETGMADDNEGDASSKIVDNQVILVASKKRVIRNQDSYANELYLDTNYYQTDD